MKHILRSVSIFLLIGAFSAAGQDQPVKQQNANPPVIIKTQPVIHEDGQLPDEHQHNNANTKDQPDIGLTKTSATRDIKTRIKDRLSKIPVELRLPSSDKIVIKLMFHVGSICDPPGKEGLTKLTAEVMMDGGTEEMTREQLKELLYPTAAAYYATVDKEVTVFTFEFHKDHLNKILNPLLGLVTRPRFEVEDFNRNLSNTRNYLEQVLKSSSDEDYSKLALEDLLFKGTNYAHPVSGTISGIKNINLDDIKRQFSSWITSGNVTIGIAGNYPSDLIFTIQKQLNLLTPGVPKYPDPGMARSSDGLEVEIISKRGALGSAIFGGIKLDLTRSNNEFAALMVANSWLGEHRKSYSRLYQKIREQRSMNYGDYSYIEWYNAGGSNLLPKPGYPRSSNYFSIWIRPVQTAEGLKAQYPELKNIKIGHAHFALRMAMREWDLLVTKGLSQEDFELTRQFLSSYIKLYVQTPAKQLGFLMDSRFYGRQDYIKEIGELLDKLTVEQVNSVMKRFWKPGNLFVTIVTDASEAEPLKESLLRDLPSPMSYSNELKAVLSGDILKEDEMVSKYPLSVKKVEIINSEDLFK
ncbi:MAG: insulinase family protein [Bacteroidia bacterium]|nr:insulinase family protein [Bacteroidia bacterium]